MEFWPTLKNIYPETGVTYPMLLRKIYFIRTLFTEHKSEININVENYLTTLQQNPDPRVYHFLEGLKDSLVHFPNYSPPPNNRTYELTNSATEKLVKQFSLSTRAEWTATIYQSSVIRSFLLAAIITSTRITENESAYMSGVSVLC